MNDIFFLLKTESCATDSRLIYFCFCFHLKRVFNILRVQVLSSRYSKQYSRSYSERSYLTQSSYRSGASKSLPKRFLPRDNPLRVVCRKGIKFPRAKIVSCKIRSVMSPLETNGILPKHYYEWMYVCVNASFFIFHSTSHETLVHARLMKYDFWVTPCSSNEGVNKPVFLDVEKVNDENKNLPPICDRARLYVYMGHGLNCKWNFSNNSSGEPHEFNHASLTDIFKLLLLIWKKKTGVSLMVECLNNELKSSCGIS